MEKLDDEQDRLSFIYSVGLAYVRPRAFLGKKRKKRNQQKQNETTVRMSLNKDHGSDLDTITFQAMLKQHERLAEDWRFHHKLIWEIPNVAVATGILAVSFTQLHSWPRIVLLAVGSFFLLALTIAVAKHRFGADIRTIEIQDLEAKLGMKPLPLVTKDAVKVYGDRLTQNKIYRPTGTWLRNNAGVPITYCDYPISCPCGIRGRNTVYSARSLGVLFSATAAS